MILFYLILAFIGGYLVGNVNFARIFSMAFAKKDITTVGSKNPGTMNMLRTRGIGEALLTLIFEAIKSGLPAIIMYYVFEYFFPEVGNVAFFLTALGAVLGHCFPVFYKFKGGKGVACTLGMFLFHPYFWWMSLIVFVVCFLLFFFINYPFIISFIFIFALSICATISFCLLGTSYLILLLFLVWMNVALIVFMHRANIVRLFTGKENKVNFKEKIFKKKENLEAEETENKEEKITP